jgi:hypothetical protein
LTWQLQSLFWLACFIIYIATLFEGDTDMKSATERRPMLVATLFAVADVGGFAALRYL